jgi:hypothetical protein
MANFTERKTVLLKGGQGERGEAAENDTTIPEDGIIMFDGVTAPTGYEETTPPTPPPPPTHDYLYYWDFTESLTDKVNGIVAVLINGAKFEQGTGVTIDSVYGMVTLGAIDLTNKTLELDITNMAESSGTTNRRFLMINDSEGFIYRGASSRWEIYYNSSWRTPTLTSNDKNLFANSTMKLVCGESNMSIYKDDTLVFEGVNPFKTNLYIGATSQAYKVVRITGARVYANE